LFTELPTALLGLLLISLAMLLAVAGAIVAHNRIPIELRESHTVPLGLIFGGLNVMFGVLVGFSAFLVLNKYQAAEQAVQNEAANVEEVYRHAEALAEPKRDEIRGLAASYARVVVEEEWPLMRQGKTSPRAHDLADDLRRSILTYEPTTSTQQSLYAQLLGDVDELHESRTARVLYVSQRIPTLLWIALGGLSIIMIAFSYLVGMENRRLHLLAVAALAGGIVLVLFMIGELDRPFGAEPRVEPEPFELVLREIEGNSGR
jgi:hypothetical protein